MNVNIIIIKIKQLLVCTSFYLKQHVAQALSASALPDIIWKNCVY